MLDDSNTRLSTATCSTLKLCGPTLVQQPAPDWGWAGQLGAMAMGTSLLLPFRCRRAMPATTLPSLQPASQLFHLASTTLLHLICRWTSVVVCTTQALGTIKGRNVGHIAQSPFGKVFLQLRRCRQVVAPRAHPRLFLTQSSAPRMGGRSRVSTTTLPSLTWCRDCGLRRRSRSHPLPCSSMLHWQVVRESHLSPALPADQAGVGRSPRRLWQACRVSPVCAQAGQGQP